MTDFCKICLAEAISLDDWYLKTISAHGKTAVIECICPWCVNEYPQMKEKAEKYDDLMKANSEIVKQNILHTEIFKENKQLKEFLGCTNKKFIKTGTMIYEDESKRPKDEKANES